MNILRIDSLLITASTVSLLILTGCSDSSLATGGGAGDGNPDPEAVALITPFVGIYNLPDNWNGNSTVDEAYLEIQEPNDQGVAVATLYDFDDINNCLPSRPTLGEVSREPVGNRVFLDNILAFNESVLTLDESTTTVSLIISFEDFSDIDNDNIFDENISLTAPRVGVATIDELGSAC
ncbi:MAG: hypothetical protein KTR32_06165 [Granulosicoccus sp.]|nr:hypothetical protein [Granulosicoccus sp.]